MKDHQELLAENTCKAISSTDRAKVKACLEVSTECLTFPGKWNPLHHALENNLYDWLKGIFKDVYMSKWDRRQKSSPDIEFENLLADYSTRAYDRYDRTLEYRLKRRDEKHRLERELDRSTSWVDTIRGYDGLIDFTIKELGIGLVDSLHEKAVHTQKIQQNAISKGGQQSLMAGRSIGLLASAGPINFALSLAWIYGENFFRGRLYQAVGELGERVAPLVGYSPESGRQYLPQIVDNTISFILMPQYYVASSILNTGVYYGFKDTGYDNAEAFAQLAVDAVAYSTTVSRGTAYKVDEQYRYNLKNNLTALPLVGQTIAPWLTPLIASVDSFSNQFNEYVNYPVDALMPYYSKSSLMKLSELVPAPVRASFEAVKSFHQAKSALQQQISNGFEGAALTLMNDSVFKQNRLHALQMVETQRLHTELSNLQNRLEQEKSGMNRAGQVAYLERNIAQGVQDLNASSELEHQLFKQTEGCAHFEQWQAKYEQFKLAEIDKNTTQQRKNALEAELKDLKEKSEFYNNGSINKWADNWAKGLDETFAKNAHNFIDTTNMVKAIEDIIKKSFLEGGDRVGIAKIASSEIMRYRYPFGTSDDNPYTAAEKQTLINQISTDELKGYKREPDRCKRRLYDYIYAKLSNTPKKPHIPRHERIIKPFVNEILGKTIGVIPFKDFKGGRTGPSGSVGLQMNKSPGQSVKVDLTMAGTPVARLRGDKKESKMTLTLPKKAVKEVSIPQKQPHTKIAMDNPYVQKILDEQYQETFGKNEEPLGKVVTKREEPLGKQTPKVNIQGVDNAVSHEERFKALVPCVKVPGEKLRWNKVEKEIRSWQKINKPEIPKTFDRLMNDFKKKSLVAKEVFTEAITEFVDETKEGLILTKNFVSDEVKLAMRGEELQSKKAFLLLTSFMGAEAARMVLRHETATSQYVKQIASDFVNLSGKEQSKAILKIQMSCLLPGAGVKLATRGVGVVAKAVTPLLKLYEQKSIAKTRSFSDLVIQRSTPAEIHHGYGKLSKRQSTMLSKLPTNKSTMYVKKSDFSVSDLAALTAKTGDEFAMFTLGSRRLIVRGNKQGVSIGDKLLEKIKTENWKWSAHVHPGTSDLVLNASGIPGDRLMLATLEQEQSLILNSAGRRNVFNNHDNQLISSKTKDKKIKRESQPSLKKLKVKR